jgi:peptide chain release factor subunit 1
LSAFRRRVGSVSEAELEKLRLKRLVRELSRKKGRGTELVTLYIPAGRNLSDVINYLRAEYSTASNIKSDTTRKHVQDALTRVIERLKVIGRTPPNGLVVFAGAIPQNGAGSERMEIYVIEPPEPVSISLYRCDDHFHTHWLEELLKEKEVYGVISVEVDEAAVAVIEGGRISKVVRLTSGIPGKHRAGGQSARRFERLREAEINEFFKRIAKRANEVFLENEVFKRLVGVIVAGPGPTKEDFLSKELLDYRIKRKILGVVDTGYGGAEGVREAIERGKGLLEDAKIVREREIVNRFLREISRDDGKATYGEKEVIEKLLEGAVDTVIIADDYDKVILEVKCEACGSTTKKLVKSERAEIEAENYEDRGCPHCKKKMVKVTITHVIDYIEELARSTRAKVALITSKSEHGRMFKQFGGIGAILRY